MSQSGAANAKTSPPTGSFWHRLASPARFMRFARRVQPWVTLAALGLFVVGLYLSLYGSPADYQQGETVRIMYVHVPAAWMAMMIYGAMALASAVAQSLPYRASCLWFIVSVFADPFISRSWRT